MKLPAAIGRGIKNHNKQIGSRGVLPGTLIFWRKLVPYSMYRGEWNSETESVDFSGPFMGAGTSFDFSEGFELPEDDYTFGVTMGWDDIERKTIYYPGKKELPFVGSATMNYEWLVDGSLKVVVG